MTPPVYFRKVVSAGLRPWATALSRAPAQAAPSVFEKKEEAAAEYVPLGKRGPAFSIATL